MSETVLEQLRATLGGTYTIERELGGGGMSRVFVADELALGRKVVVKVVAPERLEGISAERFTREVRLAARLQQANIVPLLSAGSAAACRTTRCRSLMVSLRSRLTLGGPVGVSEATHILRDVAKALAYAHAQGVVHRDIKPENVLLSGGTAMVTDFGIAKALTASRTQDGTGDMRTTSEALTSAGMSLGTPAYMAPEQAIGSAVDFRADLYAWGVMAYELLTGAHPFAGRITAQQLIAAQIAEAPAPVAGKNPAIPARWRTWSCGAWRKTRRSGRRRRGPPRRFRQREHARSAGRSRWSRSIAVARDGPPAHPADHRRRRDARHCRRRLGSRANAWAVAVHNRKRRHGAGSVNRSIAVLPPSNLSGDKADDYFGIGLAEEMTRALSRWVCA